MERLFSPCTGLHGDLLIQYEADGPVNEDLRDYIVEPVNELNLDVSTEELLSPEMVFTYTDLYAMVVDGNTVAWLNPHAAFVGKSGRAESYYNRFGSTNEDWCGKLEFDADGQEIDVVGASPEHVSEICDIVLRLLAASDVHSVALQRWGYSNTDTDLISAPSLAYLMEQCQNLKALSFTDLDLMKITAVCLRPIPGQT
jgi:hypothetical protein